MQAIFQSVVALITLKAQPKVFQLGNPILKVSVHCWHFGICTIWSRFCGHRLTPEFCFPDLIGLTVVPEGEQIHKTRFLQLAKPFQIFPKDADLCPLFLNERSHMYLAVEYNHIKHLALKITHELHTKERLSDTTAIIRVSGKSEDADE